MLTLSCHVNDAGEQAYPSIRLLAFETGLSRQAVITHLQCAEVAGWVRIRKHGFAGQKWSRNEYDPCIPDDFVPLSLKDEEPTYQPTRADRVAKRTASAVISGALVKTACARCGIKEAEAHHLDPENHLKVEWLCRACHLPEHRAPSQPNRGNAVNDVDHFSLLSVNDVDLENRNAVNVVTERGQPNRGNAVNDVDTNSPVEPFNEKTTLLSHSDVSARSDKRKGDKDLDFEEAWRQYPKRDGGNPKAAALRAWRARLREGETPDRLIAATAAYAAAKLRSGDIGTRFIKLGSTFFGTDRPYADFLTRQDEGAATISGADAPWWQRAGFAKEWQAINAGCVEEYVHMWRNGERIPLDQYRAERGL
ncbi:hypothetical protein ACQUFY_10885 [Robbsia andropogonis]|uniref:hypothetical protein n=1 Tax=Robbsia andropogonis TaxID=28092 RepID=UPI003D1EB87D